MKYRKKPVVINAIQFDGTATSAVEVFEQFDIPKAVFRPIITFDMGAHFVEGTITIPTLEGEMIASAGDWIIKGIEGEYYPCKPEIFAKTYEAVEDMSPPIQKHSPCYDLNNLGMPHPNRSPGCNLSSCPRCDPTGEYRP